MRAQLSGEPVAGRSIPLGSAGIPSAYAQRQVLQWSGRWYRQVSAVTDRQLGIRTTQTAQQNHGR
jgi:hypothetical protein